MKRVRGKTVQKYIGYLGKSPNSRKEIEPEIVLQYLQRLLKKGVSQEDIDRILRSLSIEYDAWPVTRCHERSFFDFDTIATSPIIFSMSSCLNS